MKRNSSGVPVAGTMFKWNASAAAQPVQSCQLCRARKLRCDRNQPCANCILRNHHCVFPGRSEDPRPQSGSPVAARPALPDDSDTAASVVTAFGFERGKEAFAHVFDRLERLEHTVYHKEDRLRRQDEAPAFDNRPLKISDRRTASRLLENIATTPNSAIVLHEHGRSITENEENGTFHLNLFDSTHKSVPYAGRWLPSGRVSDKLPQKNQAVELFNHFVNDVDIHYRILHVPTAWKLLEQSYQHVSNGYEPDNTTLLFLYSIFASSAFFRPDHDTQNESFSATASKYSFRIYSQTAMSLLDKNNESLPPSTLALQALSILGHLFNSSDGFSSSFHLLRNSGLVMAQSLRIHQLDTPQKCRDRASKPTDMVDIETQRRIWWHIVSSDWLLAFLGGPQEGTYSVHPRHMNVKYPSNVDDEFITMFEDQYNLPLSIPTTMSSFIQRIKLAELCREVVDCMPSTLLEPQDLDYDVVLGLHAKFQEYIHNLPIFFQLDASSVKQSNGICKDRPYLAWQRNMLHFGLHTRICRIHRPFLLEGSSNPKYAFSRMMCIRSAQTVLELKRLMDEQSRMSNASTNAAKFFTSAQHVFMAIVTLATDLCFNSVEPNVEARKLEILNACKLLEDSQQLSPGGIKGIEKGVQAIEQMLEDIKSQPSNHRLHTTNINPGIATTHHQRVLSGSMDTNRWRTSDTTGTVHEWALQGSGNSVPQATAGSGGDDALPNEQASFGGEDWSQLWTDFFEVAPELDAPHWNSLLSTMDFSLGPG